MAKLQISQVHAVEGNLYEVWGEDCAYHCYDMVVEAIVDGDIYWHDHHFKGCFQDEEGFNHPNMGCRAEAEELTAKVADRGVIDTRYWSLVGNISEMENPMVRLERAWSDNSDHFED